MSATPKLTAADQHEMNLRSGDVGVRWQAQMEDHLHDVRALASEAMLHGIDPAQAALRGELAKAHAVAALALALANGFGDLELPLSEIAARPGHAAVG